MCYEEIRTQINTLFPYLGSTTPVKFTLSWEIMYPRMPFCCDMWLISRESHYKEKGANPTPLPIECNGADNGKFVIPTGIKNTLQHIPNWWCWKFWAIISVNVGSLMNHVNLCKCIPLFRFLSFLSLFCSRNLKTYSIACTFVGWDNAGAFS